jgi:hypothetical protein
MTASNVIPLRGPRAAAARLERLANRPLTPCRRELRDLAARFRAIAEADRVHDLARDHEEEQLELGVAA